MREKQRYLLVEASTPIQESEESFSNALSKELIRCIGEINYHTVNPKLMKMIGRNRFIMKSSLDGIDQLVLAFAMVKIVNGRETAFYTLKTSGTIKTLLQYKD